MKKIDGKPTILYIAQKMVQLYESAAKRGLECDLTYTEVRNLVTTKQCYISGIPIFTYYMKSGDTMPFDYRTIDRIDSSKGYVKGNVAACSHLANSLKNMWFEQNDTPSLFKDADMQSARKILQGLSKL